MPPLPDTIPRGSRASRRRRPEDTEEDRATTGFIELEFLAFPPIETAPAGPTSGRVLNAALFLPTRYLEDASAIRIQSAGTVTTLPLN